MKPQLQKIKQIKPLEFNLEFPASKKIGRTIVHSRNVSSQINDI